MARPERLCRAPRQLLLRCSTSCIPAVVPSLLRVRFAHSKFAPGVFVELFSFELSGIKFPVPPIHSGRHYRMARPERFELPTARFVAGYSIQLSYGRAVFPAHNTTLSRGVRIIRVRLLIVNHSWYSLSMLFCNCRGSTHMCVWNAGKMTAWFKKLSHRG